MKKKNKEENTVRETNIKGPLNKHRNVLIQKAF